MERQRFNQIVAMSAKIWTIALIVFSLGVHVKGKKFIYCVLHTVANWRMKIPIVRIRLAFQIDSFEKKIIDSYSSFVPMSSFYAGELTSRQQRGEKKRILRPVVAFTRIGYCYLFSCFAYQLNRFSWRCEVNYQHSSGFSRCLCRFCSEKASLIVLFVFT